MEITNFIAYELTIMRIITIFCCLLFIVSTQSNAQLIAFPGAEGFGKFASGGRGGKVVEVTNVNDSGIGSLRWALEQYVSTIYVFKDSANPLYPVTIYEPLTVVFRVSGNINLKSDIRVRRDNLTIAGQTAPCDGICITGRSVLLNGATTDQLFYWGPRRKNIIVRYLRFRPGVPLDANGTPTSAFVTYGLDVENYENVMIDHCSISWANEECLAIYDNKNTTVQWCIVSEGLYNAYHIKGIRGYGGVWGGQFASYHHNLLAHQNSRTPRFNGARAHDTLALVEYSNNVNYNWLTSSGTYGGDVEISGGMARLNELNNYYKPGPATPSTHKLMRPDYSANARGVGRFHVTGNIIEGNIPRTTDNWLAVDFVTYIPVASRDSSRSDTLFTLAQPINLQTAQNAYDTILVSVGACLPRRDTVDLRIIKEVRTKTTSGTGTSNKPGIIDAPAAVGGWPAFENCSGAIDTDHDGMPDDWEVEQHLNPFLADNNVIGDDGYTMLENYLNGITSYITPQTLCPDSNSFTLITDVKGNNYQWEINTGNGFEVISGAADTLLNLQLPTAAYGYQYRCKVNGNRYSRTFKIKFKSIWTGNIDNAWEEPGNWSCNKVPDENTDAVIPSGMVQVNSNTTCRSIFLQSSDAQVNVKPDYNLTVTH
jgi:hypothetical protein